jgi:ParB family chromosome partitioning protein
MSKDKSLLDRFGANLAESMGANRVPRSSGPPEATQAPSRHDGTTRLRSAAEIEVGRIAPDPGQPRTEFDRAAIDRLAESIATHGQLQPISVRWSDDMGRYLIVTGERRWRAAVQAGRPTVAAVVVEGERTDSQILEMQLIENCLREDLKPVEQARAFRTLMDRNTWTATRLAEVLHLSGAAVTRALALLDLPCTVQDRVEAGDLAPSVAYEVSKLDDPDAQREVAERVVRENLSRQEVVEAVRRSARPKGRGATPRPAKARPRTFRTAAGKVTIEPTRGAGPDSLLAAAREVVSMLEAEQGQGAEAA